MHPVWLGTGNGDVCQLLLRKQV
uniref:Uncharacterized protein n=1 Tax=Anguilla anguilla TaxID=7936 RepID=A0A0E9SAZ6_ANGAN